MRRLTTDAATVLLLAAACCVVVCGGAPYFGAEVGLFKEHAHEVRGTVYAVDDRTLYLKGFSYDGQGPDAFFWGGSSSKPDASGFIIPDEKGKKSPLQAYRGEDLLLRLPAGKTLRDVRWIAVWCKKFTANFGEVFVSPDLVIPAPAEVGRLPSLAHGVSSGPVMVVDTHTLLVPDFTYDGKGPAAYFWVSRGARQHPRGVRLPDENGSLSPLSAYSGKTLVISLPSDFSVHNFDWFGVWCEEAAADFGSVRLPSSLQVPPSPRTLGIELEYKLNCEVLRDDLGFEVRWIMDGEDVVLQMVARLQRGEYMSFGLSKNDSHSAMEKADAIVAWMDRRGKGHAVDYHLDTKEQCVGRRGSCPDVKLAEGHESVALLNAAEVNGYTMVTVKRPQVAMDERYDQHVYSDGPQAVVWAVGPLNDRAEVSYHGGMRSEGDIYIDFARSPQWNCPQPADPSEPSPAAVATTTTTRRPSPATRKPVSTKRPSATRNIPPPRKPGRSGDGPPEGKRGWSIPPIVCPSDRTLRFQVGPSGGKKGFRAITGTVGWGVSWYVNGILLPEITLERGQSYTFVVEGGNDPENPARTHPLYLSDDPEGGLEHKTPSERKKVRVLAGVSEDRSGKLTPTGKGRLCEWRLPTHLEADSFATFDAFQENLELRCERGKAGRFVFKPDSRTPDTLYYQCFSHRHIGWKIHVVDSCDGLRHAASVQHVSNVTYNTVAESDFKRSAAAVPPPANQKRRHFFPTTSAPREGGHPATMESFHLGDVLRPQKYSQPNFFHVNSPSSSTSPRRRQPQVSELKDALQWWNGRPSDKGRQRDHAASASHPRPFSLGPRHHADTRDLPHRKQKTVVPVLLLTASSSKRVASHHRESPLVPLVVDKSGGGGLRQVISLFGGGGGTKEIRVIRMRRETDHAHEDHDHHHKGHDAHHTQKSHGERSAPSLLFLLLLALLSF